MKPTDQEELRVSPDVPGFIADLRDTIASAEDGPGHPYDDYDQGYLDAMGFVRSQAEKYGVSL